MPERDRSGLSGAVSIGLSGVFASKARDVLSGGNGAARITVFRDGLALQRDGGDRIAGQAGDGQGAQ